MEQKHGNWGDPVAGRGHGGREDQAAAVAVGEVGGGQGESMQKKKVSERGTD